MHSSPRGTRARMRILESTFRMGIAFACASALALTLAGPAAAQEDVSLTGTLAVAHADYFAKGKTRQTYYLQSGSKRIRLKFRRNPATHAGDRISLKGTQIGSTVEVESASYSEPRAVAAAPEVNRKVALILFNFQNSPATQPWTLAQARTNIFTGSNSANAYYEEESDGTFSMAGKQNVDGDVFGYYTIPYNSNGTCAWQTWIQSARNAAIAAGEDMAGYDDYVYASPQSSCGFGGVAYLANGSSNPAYKSAFLNGNMGLRVATHELGHRFGVHHSSTMRCGTDPLPIIYKDYGDSANPVPSGCSYGEYGDPFDVMGAASTYQHNNQHKGNLEDYTGASGFLAGATQTITQDNVYTLAPSEPGFTGNQVLRLPRTASPQPNDYSFYYLDFRQRFGTMFDTFATTSPAVNGVTIRTAGEYGSQIQTRLIDTTPGTTSFGDAPLAVGQSYLLSDIGVTIKTLSVSASGAQVQIGDVPAPASPISISGSRLTYAAGGSANDVTISSSGSVHTVTDRGVATLQPGSSCQATGDPQTVTCNAPAVTAATIDLGAGDDRFTATSDLDFLVIGGDGNDSIGGGTGNDVLRGGLGTDSVAGGGGIDIADYSDHIKPVKADLDAASADDGHSGEKDSIATDVEGLTGGSGADKLTGSAGANTLSGLAGKDRLSGKDGNDVLSGGAEQDTLFGDNGDDLLAGDAGKNTLKGGAGNDTLGSISDLLNSDLLDGGTGDDTFNANDGDDRDRIRCGAGIDVLHIDPLDARGKSDCE